MVGNKPNFNLLDVLRAFLFLEGRMGRSEIADRIGLGEGTARTILKMLKKKKLIGSTNKGNVLTKKGVSLKKKILDKVRPPQQIRIRFYKGLKNSAILYRNSRKIRATYTLRDIAVKNGAEAAIILRYDKVKGLLMDCDAKHDYRYLEKELDLSHDNHNNLVVITFAKSKRDAENSGLSVVAELDKKIRI